MDTGMRDIINIVENKMDATVARVNESLSQQEKSAAKRDAAILAEMSNLRHEVEQGQASLRLEAEQRDAKLRLEAEQRDAKLRLEVEQRDARQFKAYISALATAVIIIVGAVCGNLLTIGAVRLLARAI